MVVLIPTFMNNNIPLPCAGRLRVVPDQFSWIDHRLVRDRHICGKTPRALALYLFLCTVADARGVSYYSDRTLSGLLGWTVAEVAAARSELIGADLIAYQAPYYQVLRIIQQQQQQHQHNPLETTASTPRGQVRSAGEILGAIFGGQKP